MIAEGANLAIQSRYLKIDERDILSLLEATAYSDSIGAITVKRKHIFAPVFLLFFGKC